MSTYRTAYTPRNGWYYKYYWKVTGPLPNDSRGSVYFQLGAGFARNFEKAQEAAQRCIAKSKERRQWNLDNPVVEEEYE